MITIRFIGSLRTLIEKGSIQTVIQQPLSVKSLLDQILKPNGIQSLQPDYIDLAGELRSTIVILVDGKDIMSFDGLDTEITSETNEMILIPVVHGGFFIVEDS